MAHEKGFTLLISIITTSLLLLISFVVVNIALKQLILAYSGQESQHAFYNAESGIECAMYYDLKNGTVSAFDINTPGTITCNGQTITTGSQTVQTSPTQPSRIGGGGGVTDTIWVEDALPSGATELTAGGDVWNWVSSNPTPYSGSLAHKSISAVGMHQHFFNNAISPALTPGVGDKLIAYVYINPADIPSEIMLQWWLADGSSWNHRAYWGTESTGFAPNNQISSSIPPTGSWVRLEVPASTVGLEGQTVSGMAFTLYGGQVTWDRAGKSSGSGASIPSIFQVNFTHGCAIVQVSKSGGNTTIDSRGYNTCVAGAPRRFERGITLTY